MKLVLYFAFMIMLFAAGCSNSNSIDSTIPSTMFDIHDRDHRFLYRARMPESWISRDPLHDETLTDTTKAICEFIIRDDNDHNGNGRNNLIRISIHNFPSDTMEDRIPPAAQVSRWQRQFDTLPNTSTITPQAFSGYSGLLFSGKGILQGKETMMLAWSLQLAPEHYRALAHPSTPEETAIFRQMRADITIKAVGPQPLMEKHQASIAAFARSFELIEEVPSRS